MSEENTEVTESDVVESGEGNGSAPQGTREEAILAVKEALGKATSDPPASKAEAEPEKEPEQKEPPPDDFEEETSRLRKVLKAREKAAEERSKAQEEARALTLKAQQEYQNVLALRAQVEQQAKWLKALKENPVEAVRNAGWDPEEFILGLANQGTPEGKQRERERQLEREIQNLKAFQAQVLQQQQRQQQEQQLAQAQAQRTSVEQEFLQLTSNAEKHPALSKLSKINKSAVISWGDEVSTRVYELTGKFPSLDEVAEYLEEQVAKEYNVGKVRQDSTSKAQKEQPGKKTPSPSPEAASEKRVLEKPLKTLQGEDRKLAAMLAVRNALKSQG